MNPTKPTAAAMRAAAAIEREAGSIGSQEQFAIIIDREFAEVVEALRFTSGFPYAGGRSFKDVEPVKSALAKLKE